MPDQVDWRALEREASPGRAVGRLLRDQREAKGLGLGDIEKSLRIRHVHLEAIEEGRFDKLPGAAYIPAFLRAYAAHVGLDPEKVLTAYHLSGPVPIKRPMTLPADFPVVDRRAPIGLAVLTVLLVVGAGYAAWHYLPREQAVVAEKVPPVPDRLLASGPGGAANHGLCRACARYARFSGFAWPRRRGQAAPGQVTQEVRKAPGAGAGLPACRCLAGATRQRGAANPDPGPARAAGAAGGRRRSGAAAGRGHRHSIRRPGAGCTAAGPARAAQRGGAQPAPRAAAPVEEATARNPATDPPAVFPVKVDTPVSVRNNSWVELRAPNGDILAQTYVRAGESYVVPAGIAYRVIDAR